MIIFGVVVVAIGFWALIIYNQLVIQRNAVRNAFSQIDVQLQRRYDLIPNLVEVSKQSMKHERETLEAVIQARNQAQKISMTVGQDPTNGVEMKNLAQAESVLTQAMTRFMALSESYPDLKANSTLNTMLEEVTSTENKISFARQAFNDAVFYYNNARETFPNVLIANTARFTHAESFEVANRSSLENVRAQF